MNQRKLEKLKQVKLLIKETIRELKKASSKKPLSLKRNNGGPFSDEVTHLIHKTDRQLRAAYRQFTSSVQILFRSKIKKTQVKKFVKGNANSGNFDHAGRPGEQGGSGPGGGSEISMQQGLSGISAKSFGQLNYRGIKVVSFNNTGNKKAAEQNATDIHNALSKVPERYVSGMHALYVTGGDQVFGSASYIPVAKQRGYVSDEIMLLDGWIKKSSADREQTLLHEVGHRIQLTVEPKWFKEFKAAGLDKYFNDVTDPEFAKNYPKAQHAGETFAESFARHATGAKQPEALNEFWKGRK